MEYQKTTGRALSKKIEFEPCPKQFPFTMRRTLKCEIKTSATANEALGKKTKYIFIYVY